MDKVCFGCTFDMQMILSGRLSATRRTFADILLQSHWMDSTYKNKEKDFQIDFDDIMVCAINRNATTMEICFG